MKLPAAQVAFEFIARASHRIDHALWRGRSGDIACTVLMIVAALGLVAEIATHAITRH